MTASAIIVYGVFGVGSGALLLAVLLKVAHLRWRARAAPRAILIRSAAGTAQNAPLPDGPTILAGTVEADDLPGPVIARKIEQKGSIGYKGVGHVWQEVSRTLTARPFLLVCDSGERLLVTPGENVLLPFPFDTIDRVEKHKRYCTAAISPGQRVYVEGVIQRERSTIDSGDGGYRDAPSGDPAPAVLHGNPLLISTRPLEEHYETDARLYKRTAKWLALAFVLTHCAFGEYHLLQIAGTTVTAVVTNYSQRSSPRTAWSRGSSSRVIEARYVDAIGATYTFEAGVASPVQIGKQVPFTFVRWLPFIYLHGERPVMHPLAFLLVLVGFPFGLLAIFMGQYLARPWHTKKRVVVSESTPLPEFVTAPVVRMSLTSRVSTGRSSKKRRRGHL